MLGHCVCILVSYTTYFPIFFIFVWPYTMEVFLFSLIFTVLHIDPERIRISVKDAGFEPGDYSLARIQ